MLFVLLSRNLEKKFYCHCEILSFFEIVNFWPNLTFFPHEIYLAWIIFGQGNCMCFKT